MKANEALNLLKEGNQRFVQGNSIHPHSDYQRRASCVEGQSPFAVVLSCADSRVPPEIIFDQGIGDIFVIRVAGNVAQDKVKGSIEYAVKFLGSKLVVVMGHEKCGAVNASFSDETFEGHIGSILNLIKPAVKETATMDGNHMENAVKQNAINVSNNLKTTKPILDNAVQNDSVQIVAAYYKLQSGEVEFL